MALYPPGSDIPGVLLMLQPYLRHADVTGTNRPRFVGTPWRKDEKNPPVGGPSAALARLQSLPQQTCLLSERAAAALPVVVA